MGSLVVPEKGKRQMNDPWDHIADDVPDRRKKKGDDPDQFLADFLADNTQFDRERWFSTATKSKSKDGTQVAFTIRLPHAFGSLTERIIRSETNPLTMPSEVHRNALAYGLLHYAEMAAAHDSQAHIDAIAALHDLEAESSTDRVAARKARFEKEKALLDEAADNDDADLYHEVAMRYEMTYCNQWPAGMRDEFERALDRMAHRFEGRE